MTSSKDAVIMGTNSYSIVSKRSVECLYLTEDPQFFAEFVPQLKRRSPLINRGYWLRMKAVEDAVKAFIDNSPVPLGVNSNDATHDHPVTGRQMLRKVVINLGCGDDALPFRVLEQLSRSDGSNSPTGKLLFIDVDYQDLMEEKAKRVVVSDLLRATLQIADAEEVRSHPLISVRAQQYAALGADLNSLESVARQLHTVTQEYFSCSLEDLQAEVMFIAEVSITYMPTAAADALLNWTATKLPQATKTFVLLEQILPAGHDHPFARTMLDHFKKSAPLESVSRYPNIADQRRRFVKAGWKQVNAKSLWDVWKETDHAVRQKLETTEPFDEWEEFALFCSHYVFLVAWDGARTADDTSYSAGLRGKPDNIGAGETCTGGTLKTWSINMASKTRRFGDILMLGGSHTEARTIAHMGGYNSENRLSQEADFLQRSRLPPYPDQGYLRPVDIQEETAVSEAMIRGNPSPFILQQQDLGPCTTKWSPSYLSTTVGAERIVIAHEGKAQSLTFISKNFGYSSISFGDLIHRAVTGEHVYMRALADGRQSSTTPTSLYRDFKTIAADFKLPGELQTLLNDDTIHSSVLRVAGRINMWLHYDVMANVLCQVRGHKRIVLFPPDDILGLGFVHGTTTSDFDVFASSGLLAANSEIPKARIRDGHMLDAPPDDGVESIPKLPTALASFTVTPVQTESPLYVLVGGRMSPRRASDSCWALGGATNANQWRPIASLTPGRFRHNATAIQVGDHSGVIVFGGKTGDGNVLGSWHIYAPSMSNEWITPRIDSDEAPEARFGAAINTISSTDVASSGWLTGGMDQNHRLLQDFWEWTLLPSDDSTTTPTLSFTKQTHAVTSRHECAWPRFGAVLTPRDAGGAFLIGGVGPDGVLLSNQEIINIDADLIMSPVDVTVWEGNRPLLVGHSAIYLDSEIIITGGGAVCFSFGSFWNKSTTVLKGMGRTSSGLFQPQTTTSAALQPLEAMLGPGDCLFIPACWPHATAPGPLSRECDMEDGHMNVAVNVFYRSLEKGYAAGRDVYGNRDLDCYQNGRRDVQKIVELLKGCDLATKGEACKRLASLIRGESKRNDGTQATPGSKEALRIRDSVQTLPEQLQRFYLRRLAAEIEDIAR